MEDARWARVRQIVREELDLAVDKLLAAMNTKQFRSKVELSGGEWKGVTEEQMKAWKQAYPLVPVEAELRRAAAWCISNPNEAPRSQFSKYLNTWLGREQNRRALHAIPTERPKPSSIPPSLCEYCLSPSTISVNGRRACDRHSRNAMDGDLPPKMPGVQAKMMAGRD